jgi:hypothetical protein
MSESSNNNSNNGRLVIAMSHSNVHKRTRGNVFDNADEQDDDVATTAATTTTTTTTTTTAVSSPRSLLQQAEQLHADASDLAVSGKLSGALWRWHEAVALVSAAECAVPPRIAILVHDAIAQAHLELANDFAAIASAEVAIAAAESNGQRCASATLTLARAQRNLGELSMAKASYERVAQWHATAADELVVVLPLDDDDRASVDVELADVLQLLIDAHHKHSFSESDAAPMVPLREGIVLVADPNARPFKHRHIDVEHEHEHEHEHDDHDDHDDDDE